MSRRIVIGVAILLAVLAILKVTDGFAPIERAARAVTLPVARGASSVAQGISSWRKNSRDNKELTERNNDLEAELRARVVDYVRLRALEEENRSLKALLGFKEESEFDIVPARVIGRDPDERHAIILIDKGSRDGLELGMALVAEDGVYLGKITELQERLSRVTLISDEQSRVAVSTVDAEEPIGVVEGRGNGTAQLTLIPQQIELAPNDVIVTSGMEERIPANLPLGLVNTVEGVPTDPFKQASIEPLVKTDRIVHVLVLRPSVLRPE